MKKMKKSTVILCGLCAVIWTIRAILSIVYKEYELSVFFFVLNLLCAILWDAAFIKWLMEYRSNREP